jgi:capsular exopolysaccharide synthesis family protein
MLVVACTLVAVLAAAAATATATRTYESTTQLFVSAQNSENTLSGIAQGGQFTQQRVKSYADIVDSPLVTETVVRDLKLGITPAQLAKQIRTSVPLDTVLINITVSNPSPERARDIAAAVAGAVTTLIPRIETPAGKTDAPVKVTIVKPADVPQFPSSPRMRINLALGLLLGLAIGVGAAILRETLDTSVKSAGDVQDLVGAKPLGAIAEDPDAGTRPLIVHHDPQAPRAEAFRQLRTNLQFVDVDQPPRSVVLTSAVASEGKSTTCCNLAITVAQAGGRVILVEGDLRRPKVADYFGLEGAVGLTSVLTGACDLDVALQPWGRNLLSILPSGPLPPNPSEILGSHVMQELLKRLEEMADLVIIDAPPLLPVTDAAVIARHTDGAVLVVRHGSTRREQVMRAVEALRGVDARLLGSVLNRIPTKGPDAYGYGYGYGHGYYQRTDDRPHLGAGAVVPVDAGATSRRRR